MPKPIRTRFRRAAERTFSLHDHNFTSEQVDRFIRLAMSGDITKKYGEVMLNYSIVDEYKTVVLFSVASVTGKVEGVKTEKFMIQLEEFFDRTFAPLIDEGYEFTTGVSEKSDEFLREWASKHGYFYKITESPFVSNDYFTYYMAVVKK